MEALGLMGFKSHYQVSKALTIAQLPEHQCEKLVPAGEMFDILVTIIFSSQTIKLATIEKRGKLREHELVLIQMQTFEAAKLQIQVRSLWKLLVKDYISVISKND